MKCPKCGRDNASDATFCNGCGSAFASASPQAAKNLSQNKAGGVGCIAFIVLAIIIGTCNSWKKDNDASSPQKLDAKINASVRFTGTQFIITNNDSFDWTDVKMEINGGVFSGGYDLKHPVVKAGQTYTVGAMQFANSDGQRFNPIQMKAKKFSICGKTPNGLACYVGEWD